jgi:hypothetical protein
MFSCGCYCYYIKKKKEEVSKKKNVGWNRIARREEGAYKNH